MRAVIVDDHAGFRSVGRELLTAAGHVVVGEAHDGQSTLAIVQVALPDLVLLDVQLPDMDGFAVADCLARQPNAPLVVLVTARKLGTDMRRAARAPVVGLLLKEALTGAALNALLGLAES